MTITSIVPVDKRKCKVFVDEGFAFVLYRGEIGRLGLEEGGTLSEELYRQIETELLNRRARERSVDLLKASDKSESQIRSRLEEDGFPQPVIDRTIALLKKHRYVDDLSLIHILRDSYTDRVTSRIMSGYTIIPLYGGDIRLLKS